MCCEIKLGVKDMECGTGENYHKLAFDFKVNGSKFEPNNLQKLDTQVRLICDRISNTYNYNGEYNFIAGFNGDDFIKNNITLRIETK